MSGGNRPSGSTRAACPCTGSGYILAVGIESHSRHYGPEPRETRSKVHFRIACDCEKGRRWLAKRLAEQGPEPEGAKT